MVLLERCVAQLNANRVVHSHKDKEQCVCHEVLLSVVTQLLIVLTRLLVYLDRFDMDGLVTNECNREPNRYPAPIASKLDEQGQEVHILDLSG